MPERTRRPGLLSRLLAFIDDSLPMPPDEREERDTADLPPDEVVNGRRARLKARFFEKEGKGGYR